MRINRLCLSLAFCASSLAAQDIAPQAPAKELEKLERLVGTWEASGTTNMMPGMPPAKWTSTTTTRWVLDGHFLRSDTQIVGEGMPGTLQFIEFMGWDQGSDRYVAMSVNNMGVVQTSEIVWTSPDTMVQASTGYEQGQFFVDRWITKLGDDELEFVGERSLGHDDFFDYVTGQSKRTSAEPTDIEIQDASFIPMMPVSKAMKDLADMAGEYTFKGWLVMPNMPKMDISGSDKVEAIFGGTVIQMNSKGDPIEGMPTDYVGIGFMGWDEHEKQYKTFWLNNMAEVSVAEMHWMDDKLAMFAMHPYMGQPGAARHIIELDEDGKMKKIIGEILHGIGKPQRSFEGTYEIVE